MISLHSPVPPAGSEDSSTTVNRIGPRSSRTMRGSVLPNRNRTGKHDSLSAFLNVNPVFRKPRLCGRNLEENVDRAYVVRVELLVHSSHPEQHASCHHY